jgi:hypothetical protein
MRMSLDLQQIFWLRREEAMKLQPDFADRDERPVLMASCTKDSQERVIPVRTEASVMYCTAVANRPASVICRLFRALVSLSRSGRNIMSNRANLIYWPKNTWRTDDFFWRMVTL